MIQTLDSRSVAFDVERKFVRILQQHANGLVEFSFAVGDPDVCVELVMPAAAFAEFCAQHGVSPMPLDAFVAGAHAASDHSEADLEGVAGMRWGLHQARNHRL